MIETGLIVIIALVLIALAFDFSNGFHDAANSIATVVATGVLTPLNAVILAAVCNFAAMFIFDWKIAATVGKGIVDALSVDAHVIFGALIGAIIWNIITWYYGLPTSSSHALIGSLVGAVIAKAGGTGPILWDGAGKVLTFIVISPILGFLLGAGLKTAARAIVPVNTDRSNWWFRKLQLISCALYSLGHGTNDAQKTAGIILLILISGGILTTSSAIPYWVMFVSFAAMGLGTLAGGWRIVQTMGFKLTELTPKSGFCAELGGSMMLFGASWLGIPVSTTHTITGSILGAGAAKPNQIVNWNLARNILIAWIVTIPASAILGAAFWHLSWILYNV